VVVRPTIENVRPDGGPLTSSVDAGGHSNERRSSPVDAVALNQAVAEATKATLDLARSASEPAARLSRQVIDAATSPQLEPGSIEIAPVAGPERVTISVPSLAALAPDSASATAMLQQVGDRFASGVGPLSTTARHAFGFLLGPPPAKLEVRERRPTSKGA
jgi:hypothetical protein